MKRDQVIPAGSANSGVEEDVDLSSTISPDSASCRSAPSSVSDVGCGPPKGLHTVVVFDWDDTLMCTTAVYNSTHTGRTLRDLERAVEATLRSSMRLAETIIITNGSASWVNESAREYMPRLLPLLAQLRIVSAREKFELKYPDDPFRWKSAAFAALLTPEGGDLPCLNLVSIGDQLPELVAARRVVRSLGYPSLVKTLKLNDQPSVVELTGQLKRVEEELEGIVSEGRSGRRSLLRRVLPMAPEDIFAESTSWELSYKIPSVRETLARWSGHIRSHLPRRSPIDDMHACELIALDLWPFLP
mmetsp:Transcript_47539/g.133833  ORF Transcript_47539/g.133833 Transcript_47539/m.133833 type:complete len:302 (+) Transcript_47539:83-988(+)